MAGNTSTINVTLEVDDRGSVKIRQFAGQTERAGKKSSAAMKRFGSATEAANARVARLIATVISVTAVVAAIRRMVAEMDTAIQKASDLAEVSSKFSVVFAGQLDQADAWAQNLVDNYAMSTREARQYLAAMQDLLVPMGMNSKAAASLSNEIVKLAADLGSFNNLPTSQVMEDIQSALVGNYETMKKYGVVLNATKVQQTALAMGLAKTKDELTAADKAQAAYALILQGSSNAVGDMARTMEGFANQQKQGKANLEEFYSLLGTYFLPAATRTLKTINEWARANGGLAVKAKQAAIGILTGLGRVIEVMRFFHNGWLGIKLVGTAAVAAIAQGLKTLFFVLRKVMWGWDKMFEALVKLKVIARNPFDTIETALDDFAWSSANVTAHVLDDIDRTNAAYDKTAKFIKNIKKEIESSTINPLALTPSAGPAAPAAGPAAPATGHAGRDMEQASLEQRLKLVAGFNAKYAELGQSRYELSRQELAQEVAAYEAAGADKVRLAEYYSTRLTEIAREETTARLGLYQGVVGGIASTFREIAQSGGKQSAAAFRMYQATAMAEAAIGGASAYIKMLAEPLLPYPSNVIMAGVVAALAGAKMGMIAAAKPPSFDEGGISHARGIYQTGNIDEAHIPLRGGKVPVKLDSVHRAGPPVVKQKIINVLDPSVVGDYLATDAGERLIINIMARNREALT